MVKKILKYTVRVLAVILVTAGMLCGILYAMMHKIANGDSKVARDSFVQTLLETGQMKFLASWVCSKEEIKKIREANKVEQMDTENIDMSKITIKTDDDDDPEGGETIPDLIENFDENGIRIEEISGLTFYAKMMIIKNPAQVVVGTSAKDGKWGEYGLNLDELVTKRKGIAGVNGGLYVSTGNKGGKPKGVVVENGQILYNEPNAENGYYLIGMSEDNYLIIKNLEGMTKNDFKAYVEEAKIRDAVAFQEESTDKNNHFVPLVINGEGREVKGVGGGTNPRTAIGQRADGAILLLVTDGRGAAGHLGATADDIIGIMLDYGAVNAANLDGGSSSSMWYNKYEMTSVTFYYKHSSWYMPTSFVVMPK